MNEIKSDLSEIVARIPGVLYRFTATPEGAWRFLFVSPGIRDLYEVSADEALADHMALTGRIVPDDRDAHRQSVEEAVRQAAAWNHMFRIRTDSGRTKWVLGQAAPEAAEDGAVAWFGVLTDMTSLVEGEHSLFRLMAQYERSLRQRYQTLSREFAELDRFRYELLGRRDECRDKGPSPLGAGLMAPKGHTAKLTTREKEILVLLAKGYSSREMAQEIDVALATVSAHRRSIKAKLGLKSGADLARYAVLAHADTGNGVSI